MFGNETSSSPSHDEDIDDEDDYEKYYPNEPDWAKIFPKITAENYQPEMLRDAPDWESLEPDDPLFLDMPWPEERGPDASAFARHMQWKRSLTDQERKQWQKWAVYERAMMPDKFDYSLEDFIIQSMISDCKKKALAAGGSLSSSSLSSSSLMSSKSSDAPEPLQSALWGTIAHAYHLEEEDEIRAVIGAYYSAFNRQNFDALRLLWLPDETVELVLPGYNPVIGHKAVDKLYKRCVHNAKPFGSVSYDIKNVITAGYVAMVYSIETVGKGTALQKVRKKRDVYDSSDEDDEISSKKIKPKRVFTLFILRKFNKQWRIMRQFSTVFKTSTFTGDDVKEDSKKSKVNSAEKKIADLRQKLGNLNAVDRKTLQKGVVSKLKNIVQQEDGLFPTLPAEVREALENGKKLSWSTQLNDEGEWLIDGSPVTPNSGKSKNKKERKDDNVDLSNRIITQNPDGSYAVNENYRVEQTADDEENDDDDIYTVLEGNTKVPVSVPRLTIEALRKLAQDGLLTREQKTFCLSRMVMGSDTDLKVSGDDSEFQPCDIEVAFELLVLKSIDLKENPLVRDEAGHITWDSEDLGEFAEQCICIWEQENQK